MYAANKKKLNEGLRCLLSLSISRSHAHMCKGSTSLEQWSPTGRKTGLPAIISVPCPHYFDSGWF